MFWALPIGRCSCCVRSVLGRPAVHGVSARSSIGCLTDGVGLMCEIATPPGGGIPRRVPSLVSWAAIAREIAVTIDGSAGSRLDTIVSFGLVPRR